MTQTEKNLPANAGYMGSIPGSGRSPERGNGNPLQYSCWEIWWTEEPGGLQSMVSQRIRHDWVSTVSDGWTPRKWSPNYWFSYTCKAFYILVPNYPSNFTDDCSTTEIPCISLTVHFALSRICMLSFPHVFVHVIPHLFLMLFIPCVIPHLFLMLFLIL